LGQICGTHFLRQFFWITLFCDKGDVQPDALPGREPKKNSKIQKKINIFGALDQAARRRGRLFQKTPNAMLDIAFLGKNCVTKK
jgi:hypothetical protein